MKNDKLIPINPELHLMAKVHCVHNGLLLKRFVEDLIREKLQSIKKETEVSSENKL